MRGSRLLLLLICVGIAGVSLLGGRSAVAAPCTLAPEVKAYTVNQGLNSYARIVRGKGTLVRFYLGLPSCADIANGAYVQIRKAELNVKNGSTLLNTATNGGVPLPSSPATLGADGSPATFPLVTTSGSPTLADSPADVKFAVPGAVLAAGPTAGYTASFELKLYYKTAASRTATLSAEANKLFTTISGSSTKLSKLVDKQSRALRILYVPLGSAPFSSDEISVLQSAALTLNRIFPVPDGTQAAALVEGPLETTGGIRYTINGGAVDLSSFGFPGTPFCGSANNWSSIQAPLAGFLQRYNQANAGNPADRVVGVIGENESSSSAASGCDEGRASVVSSEAWIRAVPATAGALLAQEIAHTFGAVPSGFGSGYHSLYPEWADWAAGDAQRAFNVTDQVFLPRTPSTPAQPNPPYNRSAMRYQSVNWGNANTVLESGDSGYGFIGCKLGGTTTTKCTASGTTGTVTGVAASTAVSSIVITGTTDGTKSGTDVLSSYRADTLPTPTSVRQEAASSSYRLIQTGSGPPVDEGVIVSFDDTEHTSTTPPDSKGVFSFAYPVAAGATTFEFVHRPSSGPQVTLHKVSLVNANGDANEAPQISTTPPIGFWQALTRTSAPAQAKPPKPEPPGKGNKPDPGQPAPPSSSTVTPTATSDSTVTVTASVPYRTITSSGPLTNIYLGNELSCQVQHQADGAVLEFYPSNTIPGDCGTFVVVNGTLYTPDFANHGATAATPFASAAHFTPVSQTATGSGTNADPYRVVTVADAGSLRITQTDTYVVGQESYRTDVGLANTSGGEQSVLLYRGGDCYLGGSDLGFGSVDAATKSVACRGAVSTEAGFVPGDRIEEWLPITAGNKYYEAHFLDVWNWINTKQPFDDSCECDTYQDNGAGISYSLTLAAGANATRSHITNFSPTGKQALTASKTADSASSTVGSNNGYTITITNPNVNDVTLDSIVDTLPAGFTYRTGTTTVATTADPAVAGQTLTWSGSFVVPGSGSLTLHFGVKVASTPGEYYNQAAATATGYTVAPTGPTAKITVREGQDVEFTATDDGNSCELTADIVLKHPASDGGGSDVLAVGLKPTSCGSPATFSYEAKVGCLGCEIRAVVSDGVQSAEAKIEDSALNTSPSTPTASINNPTDGEKYYPSDVIVLEGSGLDDGGEVVLPDENLKWRTCLPGYATIDDQSKVVLHPPNGAWPHIPSCTIELEVTDGSNVDTATITIQILRDTDNDRMTDEFEACLGSGAASDPRNGGLDEDGDKRKNSDERFTQNGPCNDETSYAGQDGKWTPDPFDPDAPTAITVGGIYVPDGPAPVGKSGISITAINGQAVPGSNDCSGLGAESVAFLRDVYTVRFNGTNFANCVKARNLRNQQVLVTITGDGGTWQWNAFVNPFIK